MKVYARIISLNSDLPLDRLNAHHSILVECPGCMQSQSVERRYIYGKKLEKYYCNKGRDHYLCHSCVMKLPKTRKACSEQMIRQFQDPNSVYNSEEYQRKQLTNLKSGIVRWWPVTKKDGTIVNVQGKVERKYAKYLISKNIDFVAHPSSVPYIRKGILKEYHPDFYIPSSNVYIEVKSRYTWNEESKEKMKAIKNAGYNILVITGPQLKLLIQKP